MNVSWNQRATNLNQHSFNLNTGKVVFNVLGSVKGWYKLHMAILYVSSGKIYFIQSGNEETMV